MLVILASKHRIGVPAEEPPNEEDKICVRSSYNFVGYFSDFIGMGKSSRFDRLPKPLAVLATRGLY